MSIREKLEAAFEAAFPFGTHRQRGQTGAQSDRQRDKFRRLLDAEAWLDAAMMLVPEGWIVDRLQQSAHSHAWCVRLTQANGGNVAIASVQGFASTPAEALLAAIEKARM
jgi:hypothetical protein